MIIYPWISRKDIDIDIDIQHPIDIYHIDLAIDIAIDPKKPPIFESRSSGDGRWILAAWVSVTRPPEFFFGMFFLRKTPVSGILWWFNGILWWFNGILWWFNGILWWFNGILWWFSGI